MKHHQGHMSHSHSHHSHDHSKHIGDFKNRFILSFILTIPILILSNTIQNWFNFKIDINYNLEVTFILSIILYFYGGMPFLIGAIDEFKQKAPAMMSLIAMAISIAFFYSSLSLFFNTKEFFWELATLIDIMLLGHFLEAKSVIGASNAIGELMKMLPTTAHLIKNGETLDVGLSKLKRDDIILIKPSEKIPIDGIVIKGESSVDESMLTGESNLIYKNRDSKIVAGSINQDGVLTAKVESVDDTYLSKIIKLVEEAKKTKSKTQDIADKASAFLFYISLSIATLTFILWGYLDSFAMALTRSVTVLIIACPHALGLAIPLVVAITTTLTAKNGIVIRSRKSFELAKDIDVVVFDKTGTLTEANLKVKNYKSNIDEKEFFAILNAIESNSEHTIAKAIVEYSNDKFEIQKEIKNFKIVAGKGAYATIEDKEILVGNLNLLKSKNITPKGIDSKYTLVYMAIDSKFVGYVELSDTIKNEAKKAIEKLKEIGIKSFMLTGDSKVVANEVAKEIGIEKVFAEVLPNEKSSVIEKLKSENLKVAMVGDGVNDAPALAKADLAIAIGSGTDVAIESADIILVKSNPLDVVKAIKYSKITYTKMVQNLWWAGGYNIVALPLATGFLGVAINPAIGAILMSLSTIIVAINAQTIKKYI